METEKATNAADLPHAYRSPLVPYTACTLCDRPHKHQIHDTAAREVASHGAGLPRELGS